MVDVSNFSNATLIGMLVIGILLIITGAINKSLADRCTSAVVTTTNPLSEQDIKNAVRHENVKNSSEYSIATIVIGAILVFLTGIFYLLRRNKQKSEQPAAAQAST
jgi:uncharacterized membrane protein